MIQNTPFKLPKIGGRVWKTGVAVALSLAICRALGIPEPVFAGVAAVICMQPTVLQTFRKGIERLQATVIGASVALLMLLLVTYYPLPYLRSIAAGVAVIIVLWLCLAFKWMDALVLAAATVVVVLVHSEEGINIYRYAIERTLVTAVGVVAATVVNAFMFWPNVEDRFPKRLPEIAEQAFREFEAAVRSFCRRDLDNTRAALKEWDTHKEAFTQAASELSWFQDSNAVRQMLPIRRVELGPVLAEIYAVLDNIHQASHRILEDTVAILEEHPDYVVEDAQVYHIIEQALEMPSELEHTIANSLRTGDNSALGDINHDWTTELHTQFIRSMRAAHRSPRDIFPLFEVAKVGVELRNYTRSLARLRQLIFENDELLGVLRRYH